MLSQACDCIHTHIHTHISMYIHTYIHTQLKDGDKLMLMLSEAGHKEVAAAEALKLKQDQMRLNSEAAKLKEAHRDGVSLECLFLCVFCCVFLCVFCCVFLCVFCCLFLCVLLLCLMKLNAEAAKLKEAHRDGVSVCLGHVWFLLSNWCV